MFFDTCLYICLKNRNTGLVIQCKFSLSVKFSDYLLQELTTAQSMPCSADESKKGRAGVGGVPFKNYSLGL